VRPSADQFHKLAPYYDRVMQHVPYGMWVRYIHQLLAAAGMVPRSILDVACGTGTVSIQLAKLGYDVAGVDISPEMIDVAQGKAESMDLDIDFRAQDASTMDLGRTFDLAISLFDSLNYITEPDVLARACERVAAHLGRPGLLIFDLNTEYAFTEKLFDQDNLQTDENPIYVWRSAYDRGARICTVSMEFQCREGGKARAFYETHVQRAYSDDEVRGMLASAGFGEVRWYHAYSMLPPGPRTDRVYYVARIA
jgi:ubiquinone/menaquinone biosynthesis C-methylase UbiE